VTAFVRNKNHANNSITGNTVITLTSDGISCGDATIVVDTKATNGGEHLYGPATLPCSMVGTQAQYIYGPGTLPVGYDSLTTASVTFAQNAIGTYDASVTFKPSP